MSSDLLLRRYTLPGRAVISKELHNVICELKSKILFYLDTAHFVSICADIWSKKGMTSSYLGITAHFFSQHDHQRHKVTLAVRRFLHPHSGVRIREIVESILEEWNIQPQKVKTVITDNRSNMAKAFNTEIQQKFDDNDDSDLSGSYSDISDDSTEECDENEDD